MGFNSAFKGLNGIVDDCRFVIFFFTHSRVIMMV